MKYFSKLLSMLLIGSMLCTVGCKKYDDEINSLNNRVDKIEGSLNDQITPIKTDLDAIKTQLADLISDTEALTVAHASDLAALKKADEDYGKRIKALEDADFAKQITDAIAEAVKALETKDAAFSDQLANIVLDVQKYAEQIDGAIEDIAKINEVAANLQTKDEEFVKQLTAIEQNITENAAQINAILDDIKALTIEDETLKAQLEALSNKVAQENEAFVEFEVATNAKIIEIEKRLDVAEATLKDIEENVIPGLEAQIDANNAAIAQNAFSIQLILGMLDVMSKADATINTLVETLGADVDTRLAEVNNTISEQFGLCWNEILRVDNAMNAKLDAQMVEIEALRQALNSTNGDIAYLKATVDAKYDELSKNVAAVKNHLEEYKAIVTKEIEDAVQVAVDTLSIDIQVLQNKLSDLNKMYHELSADFDSFKEETNKRLTTIEENLETLNNYLAAMVQNITFVPEYTDGLATAVRVVGTKGPSLTATTLTAVFEVTPASAASVIAKNGSVSVEPLKTRAAVLKGERLAVEVIDEAAGRVKVTAFVHNMSAEYNSYAFTLNVEVENKIVASSDYVYIHESEEPEYKYVLVTEEGNKSIVEHPNWDKDREALVFEKKWTKASDDAVNALEGYVYKLSNGKDFYTLSEIETKFGMSKDALAVTLKPVMSDAHAKFVTATENALIDMISADECEMYPYIDQEAMIEFKATNNSFLDLAFNSYFKITGVDVVDGVFTIEEEGDLYWLSQNQRYVFDEKKAARVIFADGIELDMAGYCDAKYAIDPDRSYKAISNNLYKAIAVEGNGAVVKNLAVKGEESVGLFGYVNGNIADLTVLNSTFAGNHWVGGIAGRICGSIKNCHVDGLEITATPCKNADGAFDDGDKVGGIVGYSEPNSANSPAEPIENCSVKNTRLTAFRDVAGIVGAMYYGDNLKNNTVENVKIVAEQRQSQAPGYVKDANIGRILGRDLRGKWVESNYATNSVVNADLRIRYAIGAEVNVNSFDAKEHVLELSTANGLAWFSENVVNPDYFTFDKVNIVNDIDFGGKIKFADDNVEFIGISNAVGTNWRRIDFNGMNKTIRNFTWDAKDRKDVGLFGKYNGDIKNIKMENVVLKGKGRVAPIATQMWGNVDNCHVKNLTISVYQNNEDGDKLGGIVAQMQSNSVDGNALSTITNCSVTNADIEGYRDLGALAGHAELKMYDYSNKFENVTIWVNQTFEGYKPAGHYPFKNEHEVVGRIEVGAATPEDVDGVEIYNILYPELGRRYVVTPKDQLRLGYAKETDAKKNAAALWKFAEEYSQYRDVFQVTDMQLESAWTAIGTDAVPFKGTYNGNRKEVRGLNISDYNTTPAGFFGCAVGTLSGINIINPTIYGSHFAGAVVAKMFGTVQNCKVSGGKVVLMPNHENGRFDNGDKAGALVGYLAAEGQSNDKIINNTVENVVVKAYRDVAALVGCANEIHDMSGNTVKNCSVIVDQVTGKYPADDPKNPNIGLLIGRLINESHYSNVKNNNYSNSTLGRIVETEDGTTTEQIALVEIGQ